MSKIRPTDRWTHELRWVCATWTDKDRNFLLSAQSLQEASEHRVLELWDLLERERSMAYWRKVEENGNQRQQSHSPAQRTPLPHFLRTIIPGTMEEKKLSIPLDFVMKYGDDLRDAAELIVGDGRAWKVGITKSKNNIWFDGGWHEFVQHYSISYGYSMVFGYRGSSNFNVIIFDVTACEIQYPCSAPRRGEGPNYGKKRTIPHEKMEEDRSTIPILLSCSPKYRLLEGRANEGESSRRNNSGEPNLKESPNIKHIFDTRKKAHIMRGKIEIKDDDSNESCRGKLKKQGIPSSNQQLDNEIKDWNASKTNFVNPLSSGEKELLPKCEEDIKIVTFEMFTTGLKNASEESDRAIHAARMFKPKNPSFMAVLRPYNFYGNYMNVPTEFSRGYMYEVSKYIKLQVSDGREWLVQAGWRKRGHLTLGKGWNAFIRENKLEKGDVCIFELIKTIVLKVSIFRAVEEVGRVD